MMEVVPATGKGGMCSTALTRGQVASVGSNDTGLQDQGQYKGVAKSGVYT